MKNPLKGLFASGAKEVVSGVLEGTGNLIAKFKADPTKVIELEADLKKLEMEAETKLAEMDSKVIESVNATMREEAKSEHWIQWCWRPSVGFCFILIVVNNYVALPYLKKYGLEPIDIPSEVFMAILAILGVASWHRGVQKVEREKANK